MKQHDRALLMLFFFALTLGACGSGQSQAPKNIQPVYDQVTGRLKQLNYDSKNTGKFDTVSYMDGARVLRIEIDTDGDVKIDRWEYYGADQKLEKVGFSRKNDGTEDAWSYQRPDGSIERVEMSSRPDRRASRIEYYENNMVVRTEEDSDGDGKMDK